MLPAGSVVPPEETTVRVTGTATANAQAPGGVEVTDAVVEALTEPAATPPAELWRPHLDVQLPTLLDHAPVLWRHPAQRARWELAAASLRGFRSSLDADGFTEVPTPKFVESATESGSSVFAVDYFGRPAYLAQSPQFYKQQLVGVFERVYEVGPVFRAEPHDTVRHLAEYRSLDVELGFVRDHRDVLAVLREVLAGMVAGIGEHAAAAVERTGARVPEVPDGDPGHPLRRRARAGRGAGRRAGPGARARAGARRLGAGGARVSDFLAVEGYPMAKRPFYTHPQPSDPRWSNSFDLLFRGLELVTGGQRLHRPVERTTPRSARGARTRPPTRRTSRRSGTGCHRTAASRSGWSAGSRDWWRRPTSARSRSSRATCTASLPDGGGRGSPRGVLDDAMSISQATTSTTGTDRARQVVVTLAEVFCVVGTLVGVGVIGTRVEESSGGALAADATLLAPLGPAFSIWSVVYAGLAAYTVWQWLPSVAASPRARASGWLAAASMALNAAWLLVTQQGWLWTSVVVILALVLVLGLLVQRLADLGAPSALAERVVVEGTFGLYLGWVCVAVCANVTATLVAEGVTPSSPLADLVAVAVLVVVVGVAALVLTRTGRRWTFAAAAAWGLVWIAVGRLTDSPDSTVVGGAAIVAAVAVLALAGRARPTPEETRARVS